MTDVILIAHCKSCDRIVAARQTNGELGCKVCRSIMVADVEVNIEQTRKEMMIDIVGNRDVIDRLNLFLQPSTIKLKIDASRSGWATIELPHDVNIHSADIARNGTLNIRVRPL